MSDSPAPPDDAYEDLFEVLIDRAGALANEAASALRANPMLTTALVAAGIGALVGLSLARRRRSHRQALLDALEAQAGRVRHGGGKRASAIGDVGELLPLALKLIENPIVRGFVVRAVTRGFASRFR
jgi:hypothetical protein